MRVVLQHAVPLKYTETREHLRVISYTVYVSTVFAIPSLVHIILRHGMDCSIHKGRLPDAAVAHAGLLHRTLLKEAGDSPMFLFYIQVCRTQKHGTHSE